MNNIVEVNQFLLFQRLRWRLLRNNLRVLLRGSLVRVATILLCSLLIWGSLFVICYLGFQELKSPGRWGVPLNMRIMVRVFDMLFIALTVLLVFSTGIILYSSLFSSAETSFLLSSPMRADQIFAYKFLGAVAFSSWAFVLLGSPILIAYGIQVENGAPWYYYVVLPLFFLGFVLLPGCLGALRTLFLVNYGPRHRTQVLLVILLVLGACIYLWITRWIPGTRTILTRDWVNDLLAGVALFGGPWMPAHWMAQGLQSAAREEVGDMFYNLALVWSNGLFLYVVTAWLAGRSYRRGFNRVFTGGTLKRRYGGGRLDAALGKFLFFLDPQTRLLIVKDFRTFRRDPA